MSDLLGLWFKLAWVVFTECKQTSSVHVYDWINEPGLRHRAVTSTFTLPTSILSVLTQDFGINYINNFLHWSAKKFILCMVRRICIKARKNRKQTRRKLNSIFNDFFSLFLCPPNYLYLFSDKKRSGSEMRKGEISWNYLFSLQQQREFTFLLQNLLWIKVFLRRHQVYLEIPNWAN